MNLSLLKYFLYLRDVSHKIAVTSDCFNNINNGVI